MGRELKRVPLDFNFPIGQLWKGYLNPYNYQECKSCEGYGLNKPTKRISDEWYGRCGDEEWVYANGRRWNKAAWSNNITGIEVEALVRGGRLSDLLPFWYKFNGEKNQWEVLKGRQTEWEVCERPEMPSAEKVNEWNRNSIGHDAINRHICIETRAKNLGVYGLCEYCNGEGHIFQSKEIEKLHNEWKSFDPPVGEGFQLWENTSEGSPQSPVFETLDLLCEYLEESGASVFGKETASKEGWIKMLSDDFVHYDEGNMIFI